MSDSEQGSTADNWMLRLPQSHQLIGVVQVQGMRSGAKGPEGLVAAADREGFVANEAFGQLVDMVRGAIEAIAAVDRRRQRWAAEKAERDRLAELEAGVQQAIEDIESDPEIPAHRKKRLLAAVRNLAEDAKAHERATDERSRRLEVMSLLGVVAGYMTHEFGLALEAIDKASEALKRVEGKDPQIIASLTELKAAESTLLEFIQYSKAYVKGAGKLETKGYLAAVRLNRVKRTFGRYAADRGIKVHVRVDPYLKGPNVPAALYDGIALNLYTNALKAVTAASRNSLAEIRMSAWNERTWHHLEVSDTGVGIPGILRSKVFEPLFTTTDSANDPLGSGLGLGLSLVRSGVQAFGGHIDIVDADAPYATRIVVRLPILLVEEQ